MKRRRLWLIVLLAVYLTAVWASVAIGESTHPLAVSVESLKQNLDKPGVIIVDIRPAEDYQAGHIAGAINIEVDKLQTKSNAILHPVSKVEEILGSSGIDGSKELVLYGEGKEKAFLALWMLDHLGTSNVRVLDGGIEAWKAANGKMTSDARALPATTFRANPDPARYATTQQVLDSTKDPNVQIVDVRTPDEFKGEDIRSLRGGHIPGAINIPYEENFQGEGTVLKPLDELEKLYAAKLDKSKNIVVYCQTGTRSTNTYFILRELGYNVRNYDASWIEWGSNFSLPIENATYYNFAKVNKTLKELSAPAAGSSAPSPEAGKAEPIAQESGTTRTSGVGPYILAFIALAVAVAALLRRPISEVKMPRTSSAKVS
ncbi:MAG: sulfurtransferase [Actinobacteria bacterium]|nr:sulfurtransferase [Actinomycetota bacterium]